MRFARLLLAALVFSTVFMWSAPGAGACSCMSLTEQEHFDRADVVFEATVVERVDIDLFLAVLTYNVTGVYKGDARQTQQVYTHAQGDAACGLTAQVDEVYVVFADIIDGTEENTGYPIGDLRADLCGGTRLVETSALNLDPPVEPVAPIADAPTTTTTLFRPTTGAEELTEPLSGGTVLVVGFIAVGIIGAFVASRIAKKSRES